MNNRDGDAGCFGVFENLFELLAQFIDGLRGFRPFIFARRLVSGETERDEKEYENSRDDPFHGFNLRS